MYHGQKSRFNGDGHPTFNRNPYNGNINPDYWVDDHPPYGNHGSWSTLAHMELFFPRFNRCTSCYFSSMLWTGHITFGLEQDNTENVLCFCVCVFVCLCFCGCVFLFVFVFLRVCVFVRLCFCFFTLVFVCLRFSVFACLFLCGCVFVFVCLCLRFVCLCLCFCGFVFVFLCGCVFVAIVTDSWPLTPDHSKLMFNSQRICDHQPVTTTRWCQISNP